MSTVSAEVTRPPLMWFDLAGIWVHITPLDDPLLRAELHRVTVHRQDDHIAVEVAGNCATVRWQTWPPATYDFADLDGRPL